MESPKAVRYKNYLIVPVPFQRIRNGPWFPEARLTMYRGGTIIKFPVRASPVRSFKTQNEANQYIVEQAKLWIDKNAIP